MPQQSLFNDQTHREPTRYKLYSVGITVIREGESTFDLYLTSPQAVEEMVKTILSQPAYDDDQEHFLVICVNTKNRYLSHREIFRGTMDRAIVQSKEVFRYALLAGASKIILAHNHPSGGVEPSEQDKVCTRHLVLAGVDLDLHVLDHIIIGNGTGESFSFMDNHLL